MPVVALVAASVRSLCAMARRDLARKVCQLTDFGHRIILAVRVQDRVFVPGGAATRIPFSRVARRLLSASGE